MASIKNYGLTGVASDIQLGKLGGRIVFDSGNNRFDFTESNGTTLEQIRAEGLTATGTVQFGSLSDGVLTITGIIDDDTMNTASNVTLATSESIKEYVDASLSEAGASMNVAGDSGTGSIVFATETFTLNGTANEIVTSFDGTQTFTVGLVDSPQVGNLLVTGEVNASTIVGVTSFTGTNITATGTLQFGDLTDGSITIASFIDDDTMGTASNTTLATSESIKAYVDSQVTTFDLDIAGDSGTSTVTDAQTLSILGGTGLTSAATPQTITVNLANTAVAAGNYGSATQIPTFTVDAQGRITAASNVAISTTWTVSDGSTTQDVNGGETLTFNGTANEVDVVVSATRQVTFGLPNDVVIAGNLTVSGTQTIIESNITQTVDNIIRVNSDGAVVDAGLEANVGGAIKQLVYSSGQWTVGAETFDANTLTDGTLSITGGSISSAVNGTFSGTISFGSLTDSGESITVTKFVDEADGIANNDNDTTIPTSAAVKDYVDNNGGDGLLLRSTFTANSAVSQFTIGTIPNVTSRTYYADKIILKVNTAFAGGSFNHILVNENNGSGTTLVAADDADGGVIGTYVIELTGEETLTKNATVEVLFRQSNGTTPAVVTAGAITASVYYRWV